MNLLEITGYKDDAFQSKIDSYTALINPDKYTQNYEIHFNEEQGIGTSNASIKYKKSAPQGVSFELIFDGTGILSSDRTDVKSEIETFKKIAYEYNGDIHKPNYLQLIWGKGLNFKCQLTSLSLNYTLFKSDGTPLRAKASVSFKEFQNPKKIAAEEKKKSPDMTHEWVVRAGDSLPQLAQQIYGDSSQYLKVASFNKLANFRYLIPGTTLYFPPLV
jgi:LysM repeat protein